MEERHDRTILLCYSFDRGLRVQKPESIDPGFRRSSLFAFLCCGENKSAGSHNIAHFSALSSEPRPLTWQNGPLSMAFDVEKS